MQYLIDGLNFWALGAKEIPNLIKISGIFTRGGGHLILKSVTMRGLKSKKKGYFLKTKSPNSAFLAKKGVKNEGEDFAKHFRS